MIGRGHAWRVHLLSLSSKVTSLSLARFLSRSLALAPFLAPALALPPLSSVHMASLVAPAVWGYNPVWDDCVKSHRSSYTGLYPQSAASETSVGLSGEGPGFTCTREPGHASPGRPYSRACPEKGEAPFALEPRKLETQRLKLFYDLYNLFQPFYALHNILKAGTSVQG